MRNIQNVHERVYPVSSDQLGELFSTLATDHDRLWPQHWWPIRFDRPLAVGADGGHGSIRYRVTRFEPGRRVEFAFPDDDVLPGTHALEIIPLDPTTDGTDHDQHHADDRGADGHRTMLRHTLSCDPRWPGERVFYSLMLRYLHDALLEDLLDRAGRELGHPPQHSARWSPYVRMLRKLLRA